MPGWPFSVCWAFLLPPEKLPVSKIFLEIFKKAGRIGYFRCHISGKGKIHPTSPRKGGEKMEAIPRNDGEQYRFDAFCKAVLRNEARNYHRNKKRLLDREKSFSVLSMCASGALLKIGLVPRMSRWLTVNAVFSFLTRTGTQPLQCTGNTTSTTFVQATTSSIGNSCPTSHLMFADIRFVPTWPKAV